MNNKIIKNIFYFSIVISLFFAPLVFAAGTTNFQIQILAVCGNEVQEWNEDCDGEDLGVGTCITEGFNSGVLSCQEDCVYDTSGCEIVLPPPVSTSTGGSGGSGAPVSPVSVNTQTTIFFSGLAYPNSVVTLLKDAQPAATTIASADARFSFSLSGLSGGNYVFSLYTEDSFGNHSSLLTFPAMLSSKTMTEVNGVFLSPTIRVDKSEVKKGEDIVVSGQTAPNAEVLILFDSSENAYKKVKANYLGEYSIIFNTESLSEAQHYFRSKSNYQGESTIYSRAVSFLVGSENVLKEDKKEWLRGDLNEDWRVNIIDFSIGAYWYKKQLSQKLINKESQVLNGDAKIDLVDFSIMAYNWTG